LIGCGVVECLVVTLGVEVGDEGGDWSFGVSDGGEGVEPDTLLFEGAD
jgi:hypothetical protein